MSITPEMSKTQPPEDFDCLKANRGRDRESPHPNPLTPLRSATRTFSASAATTPPATPHKPTSTHHAPSPPPPNRQRRRSLDHLRHRDAEAGHSEGAGLFLRVERRGHDARLPRPRRWIEGRSGRGRKAAGAAGGDGTRVGVGARERKIRRFPDLIDNHAEPRTTPQNP